MQDAPQTIQQKAYEVKEDVRTGTWRERWPWSRVLKWVGILGAVCAATLALFTGGGLFLAVATVTAPVWIPLLLFVGLPLFVVFGIPTMAIVTVIGGGLTAVVVGTLALFLTAAWLIQYFRGQEPPGHGVVDKAFEMSKNALYKVEDVAGRHSR